MKASIGKKIAVFCLSAAMVVGIGFGVSGIEAAQAHTAEKDIVLDSYKLDSVITVSDDATTGVVFPKTVQISDTEIATAYVITYPNGVTYSVKDGIVLDQVGLYTVTYKSVVGGVSNVYSDTFKVYDNFADDTSVIELYEKNVYSNYVKLAEKGKYGIYDYKTPTADATVAKVVKGIKAALLPGDVLNFNQIIDVNKTRADGFTELVYFNPNTVNHDEMAMRYSAIDLTFTDVNDPNNYIKVTMNGQVASIGYSLGASTGTQPLIGIRSNASAVDKPGVTRVFYIDGVKYSASLNSTGAWGYGEQKLYDYKILYNPETQQLKRECVRHFDFENGRSNVVYETIIIDLDNPDIYDEGTVLFNGFSTGEVRLSVEARNFNEPVAYCEFYAIGDVANDDLRACYLEDAYDDVKAPELRVNVKQSDSNGVYTLYNPENPVKFRIPTATAYDASVCSEVSARVYKNYSDASKIFVPANGDGTFDVTEKVVYTVEYKATDMFGNVGYTTLNVVPCDLSELVEGDVQIYDAIEVVYDKMELFAGKQYNGEVLKFIDTINLKEDLKVKVTVTNGDNVMFAGEYGYADFAGENKPLFDVKPLAVGTFTVTYEFSDNVTSFVSSYDVECISTGLVDFADVPLLQRYYMLGMTYEKANFTAYKFGSTVTENPTDMYVSYDEGATWTKVNGTFVMGQGADGKLMTNYSTVKFKYTSEGVEDFITASAPIVDIRTDAAIASNDIVRVKQQKVSGVTYAGNLDQVKYFVGENAVVSKSTTNAVISNPVAGATTAVTKFINPVSIDTNGSFYLEFSTDAVLTQFNELTVRYIDAYDPTNVASVKFFISNDATRISINGAKDVDAGINLHGSSFQTNLSLTNKVYTYGKKKYDLDFNPTNKLFYVEFEMGGITGTDAQFSVITIGNHKFQLARTVDGSSPMMYYESVAGAYPIDTEIVIKVPYVVDILTPYVHTLANGTNRTKVTVTKNKQYVKDVNGVLLDGTQDPTKEYTIKLSEFATWDIKYEVSDEAGKIQSPSFQVSAIDTVAPEIQLNYGFNEDTIHNVTLGKTFSIEYSVTDNITDSTKLKTYVLIIRDSDYFLVYNSEPFEILSDRKTYSSITDSCILTRKGMYTLYIFAMDEDNNMANASYKLNVQ